MAVKSTRKTTKRSSTTKGKSMNTTYMVVGVLVVLMLVLLYIMSKPIVPTTTTTQPSLVDSVVNSISGLFGGNSEEGFTEGAPTDLYDPEKEVLIAFCKMQNCGHCVRFNDNVWTNVKPELEGKKNANGKTIKMITVDPNHELSKDVSGFPTIKKFGDDATKYVEFTESRTVENFKSFCMN
jgi:hypothetical protein